MANTIKNLGIVSPVPMGEWVSGIIYQKLNIVRHNGASYLAKQPTTTEPGVSSSWESYWQLIAKDGIGGSSVVQTTGTSLTDVMSQDAVTKQLTLLNSSISANTAQIGLNSTDIAKNKASIAKNTTDIEGVSLQTSRNTADITANSNRINQNSTDIAANKTQIAQNTSDIEKNELAIAANLEALKNKFDKTGGIIDGSVVITDNLNVKGKVIASEEITQIVKDAVIILNSDGADLSTTLAGTVIRINDSDTNNAYAIAYDKSTDSVKLGIGTVTETGVGEDRKYSFAFAEGEGEPVAVRDDNSLLTNNHLLMWDSTNNKLIDSGKSIGDFLFKTNVVQTTGYSETDVMSQNAVRRNFFPAEVSESEIYINNNKQTTIDGSLWEFNTGCSFIREIDVRENLRIKDYISILDQNIAEYLKIYFPVQTGTVLLRPNDLPTETSLVTVSSTGTHAYKKVSEFAQFNNDASATIFFGSTHLTSDALSMSSGTTVYTPEGVKKAMMVEGEFTPTTLQFPTVANNPYFAITPTAAPTEPSVVVNAVDRTPTWKPVSELGGNALKVTVW